MKSPTAIVGIGSPHGDDQVGLRLAEALSRRGDLDAACSAVRDPTAVLEVLPNCEKLILVDAIRTGAAAGTILRLEWPDDRLASVAGHSSHGFGLADVLRLGKQLGRLPPTIIVFGVEAADCGPGGEMSPSVQAAMPALEQRVLEELGRGRGPSISPD